MPSILTEGLTPLPDWLIGPTVCWLKTWGVIPYRAVHVGFSPYNVVVMVDDHRTAENMQVLHHVLLDVCQCGDLGIVAFMEKRRHESVFWHVPHVYKWMFMWSQKRECQKLHLPRQFYPLFTKSALTCLVAMLFMYISFHGNLDLQSTGSVLLKALDWYSRPESWNNTTSRCKRLF